MKCIRKTAETENEKAETFEGKAEKVYGEFEMTFVSPVS